MPKSLKPLLLGSAPSRDGIIQVIAKFYGGASITLHDTPEGTLDVHNANGLIPSTRVSIVGGRYLFEQRPPKLVIDLVLPKFKLTAKVDDPPHRQTIMAETTITNPHGVKIRVRCVSNRAETVFWASASYIDEQGRAGLRASATIRTGSRAKALGWIVAIKSGNVKIED